MSKKVSKQQSQILHELRGLEEEARQLEPSPDGDVDEMFDVIKRRLHERYQSLRSEQSKGASSAEIYAEINRLKQAAQSNDLNQLQRVYQRISELKREVLFAPTPPKININAILDAIDHIGVESDSDTDGALPPAQPRYPPQAAPLAHTVPPLFSREQPDPIISRSHITDHEDPPFSSFSRGGKSSQGSERQRSVEHDRGTVRNTDVSRHRNVEEDSRSNRSQSSYHGSAVESNRLQETASLSHKQNDSSDLLGPEAFSKPKPRVDDRHSTKVAKSPIKEEPMLSYETVPLAMERPAQLPSQGPRIEDLCKNKTIKRYFTEMTEFTNPTVDNWCYLEELYNPTLFFVKSPKVEDRREKIQLRVQNEMPTSTLRKTRSHTLGKLVLCRFSRDNQWYRGCIIQTHQEYRYTVLFVDYGNIETISYELLRDMPDEIMYMEPMCVQQCYLQGITPPDGADQWDPVATEALWDLVSDKQLKIVVQNAKNQVYGVVLMVNEGRNTIDVNKKLIEIGLAVPMEVNTSDSMKGLCTSPTRFAPPSGFQNQSTTAPVNRKTRNRSPTSSRRPQGGSNPPPASTRRPQAVSNPPAAAPIQPPTNTILEQRSSARHSSPIHSSPSDSDEEPSIGRPPSFGSTHKPLSRQINSPPPGATTFGDTSAKGRGNVFGSATAPNKGRGSLRGVESRFD